MHVFGKTLRYGLERVTGNLHSKFGPILMNTDRVLCRYALRMQLAVLRACCVVLTVREYHYWLAICGHVVSNHGLWSCSSTMVVHSCIL